MVPRNGDVLTFGAAPTVTFGLGTELRTTLSYLHQENERVPDRGILWRRPTLADTTNGQGDGEVADRGRLALSFHRHLPDRRLLPHRFFRLQLGGWMRVE